MATTAASTVANGGPTLTARLTQKKRLSITGKVHEEERGAAGGKAGKKYWSAAEKMRKLWFRIVTFLLLSACFMSRAVYADNEAPTSLGYHPYDELGIQVMTRGNAYNVKDVLADSSVRIFILQIPFEQFDLSCCPAIVDWVRQGHSFWFYDSRYAPYFGMKAYALSGKQFKGRNETGELGNYKYNRRAAGVLTMSKQDVMTGVGQCTVFLPLIGDDTYSAVALGGDTLPLLQFASDSPALAAMRREGKGVIVFKPLLWPESLSGKRFQYNLMEFSAGFGVPGIGGENRLGELIGPNANYVKTDFDAESVLAAKNGKISPADSKVVAQVKEEVEEESKTEANKGKNDENTLTEKDSHIYAKSIKDDTVSAEAVNNAKRQPQSNEQDKKSLWSDEGRWVDEFSQTTRDKKPIDTKIESKILAEEEAAAKVREKASVVEEDKTYDVVTLRNGDTFVGRCHNKEIVLETTSESLKTAPADFKSILFSLDSWSLDKCEMEDGRRLSGYMLTSEFYFSNENGDRTFKKDNIKNIRFKVPASQINR